jgi:hypothetical protein
VITFSRFYLGSLEIIRILAVSFSILLNWLIHIHGSTCKIDQPKVRFLNYRLPSNLNLLLIKAAAIQQIEFVRTYAVYFLPGRVCFSPIICFVDLHPLPQGFFGRVFCFNLLVIVLSHVSGDFFILGIDHLNSQVKPTMVMFVSQEIPPLISYRHSGWIMLI